QPGAVRSCAPAARAQGHRHHDRLLYRRRERLGRAALREHDPRAQSTAKRRRAVMSERYESHSRRCLPVEEWPEPDRRAWEAAHRRGGLLDEDGLAADWAPATSGLIAAGYGRYLSFVAATEG